MLSYGGWCIQTYKSTNGELHSNYFQVLFVNCDLGKCSCLSSTGLILWGSNYCTKTDTASAQWHIRLMRCYVSLSCRGLNSPTPKIFQWFAPFHCSMPAKGQNQSSLKYLVTWGPNIISRFKWSSGQIRTQVCVCVSMGLHLSVPIPGGLLVFWATRRHLTEFSQGHI